MYPHVLIDILLKLNTIKHVFAAILGWFLTQHVPFRQFSPTSMSWC